LPRGVRDLFHGRPGELVDVDEERHADLPYLYFMPSATARRAAPCGWRPEHRRAMVVGVSHLPRAPVVLDVAIHDPSVVHRRIDAHAPYWPVQRYFTNSAEYAALSGKDAHAPMVVAPVFRGNWAADGTVGAGVEALLQHRPFIEAAKQLFDAEIVRPTTVY